MRVRGSWTRLGLAVCALGVLSLPAAAQSDAGPAAPTACGVLDDEGTCFGPVATWCSAPNTGGADALAPTERFDCADIVVDGRAIDASCVQLTPFGAWCGVDPGERCLVPSTGGDRQLTCLSGLAPAVDGACDLVAGCTTGVLPCSVHERLCRGTFLQLGCPPFGQPRGVDCAALGGSCADAACADVAVDQPCDGETLLCGDGLRCVGADSALGVCLGADEEAARIGPEGEPPRELSPSCSAGESGSGRRQSALPGLLCAFFAFSFSWLRRPIGR